MGFTQALLLEISWISADVRRVLDPMLLILMVVLAIATIVVILMQKATSDNVGAISGESETYIGKNKGSNKERTLKIVTMVLGGCLLVVSVLYYVFQLTTIG